MIDYIWRFAQSSQSEQFVVQSRILFNLLPAARNFSFDSLLFRFSRQNVIFFNKLLVAAVGRWVPRARFAWKNWFTITSILVASRVTIVVSVAGRIAEKVCQSCISTIARSSRASPAITGLQCSFVLCCSSYFSFFFFFKQLMSNKMLDGIS